MSEAIREKIKNLENPDIVQLYAYTKDNKSNEEVKCGRIPLHIDTSKVLAQHFCRQLEKPYLSEKYNITGIDEWFNGNYESTKLRDTLLSLNIYPEYKGLNPRDLCDCEKRYVSGTDIYALIIEYSLDNDRMYLYQKYRKNHSLSAEKFLWFFENKNGVYIQHEGPDITVGSNIDALIIGDMVLSDSVDVLERDFGLNEYTKQQAQKVLDETIRNKDILSGIDVLGDDISKNNFKLCRQLVKSKNSPVWDMSGEKLIQKVREMQKSKKLYPDVVITNDNKFDISSPKSKHAFMKLINDEILTSELTEKIYDVSGTKVIYSEVKN